MEDGGHAVVLRQEAEVDVIVVLPVKSCICRCESLRGVVRFRVIEEHLAGDKGTVICFQFEMSLFDVTYGLLSFCELFVAAQTDWGARETVVVSLEHHGVS